jgi:histidinol-phosphate aminotransferase
MENGLASGDGHGEVTKRHKIPIATPTIGLSMTTFLRPNVRAMAGYTPGEQPRDGEFLKLNTNENPYPPSPRVFEALREAISGGRLRKYPDPAGTAFRQAAGRVLGVDPEGILIGNGSDDVLTIITRGLVPEGGLVVSPTPSYLLYNTLAEIQGAKFRTIRFDPDWQLDTQQAIPGANVTFIANPNSPSGTMVSKETLARWPGPLVIDEAYVDFADTHCLDLIGRRHDVIVTRSFSKSYSLAGIRFGFAVGQPELIQHLVKIKDSYNCDVLSLAAATAAIEDQDYMGSTRAKIIATRQRLTDELRRLGFTVPDSQANFVWARRSDRPVKPIYEELKRRRILVRCMNYPDYGDGLRISVGTEEEMDRLFGELRSWLQLSGIGP